MASPPISRLPAIARTKTSLSSHHGLSVVAPFLAPLSPCQPQLPTPALDVSAPTVPPPRRRRREDVVGSAPAPMRDVTVRA